MGANWKTTLTGVIGNLLFLLGVLAQLSYSMGELANIIGGNLKGLLPGPSVLSVPRVAECEPVAVHAKQLVFCCEGQPFSVTVRTVVSPKSHTP